MNPPDRTRRARAKALAVAVVAGLILLVPGGASAAEPPATVTAPLMDEADVLSAAEESRAAETLAAARSAGVDLHVLLVEDTGGTVATQYAEKVARASSMGGDDALLVVAFTDRTYALWAADALGADGAEINAILDGPVARALRADDIRGAIGAAADGLARADEDGGGDGGVTGVPVLPLLIVGGVGAFFLARRRRPRTRGGPAVAPAPSREDLDALTARANAALVQADDALRDAEHEAGFAEAQFGADEAAALRAGLARASGELKAAFALRQQLDDDVPEPAAEQWAILQAIHERAAAAEAAVQEQLDRLEALRGLERDPAAATAEIRRRTAGVAERLPAVDATIAELRAAAPAAAPAVEGNAAEAQKRLEYVAERLAAAASAPAGGAAQALRAAGAALAQAEQLLDAVDDLATRTRHAREVLPQELQEAELALARAQDLLASRRHVVGREARTRLAEAQRRFDAAQTLAARDPAAAAAEADAAERLANEAFDIAWQDSENSEGHGGVQGFGWGLPVPIVFPIPLGGIGWGGTSWGGGGGFGGGGFGGGSVGGGSFGGGSVGGGRW